MVFRRMEVFLTAAPRVVTGSPVSSSYSTHKLTTSCTHTSWWQFRVSSWANVHVLDLWVPQGSSAQQHRGSSPINVFKNTAWNHKERQKGLKSKVRSDAAALQLLWLRDKKSLNLPSEILKTDARWKEFSSRAGCCFEPEHETTPPHLCVCMWAFVLDPLTSLTSCRIALYKSILIHLAEVLLSPIWLVLFQSSAASRYFSPLR